MFGFAGALYGSLCCARSQMCHLAVEFAMSVWYKSYELHDVCTCTTIFSIQSIVKDNVILLFLATCSKSGALYLCLCNA